VDHIGAAPGCESWQQHLLGERTPSAPSVVVQ